MREIGFIILILALALNAHIIRALLTALVH